MKLTERESPPTRAQPAGLAVEDSFVASPLQEGMLFHSLYEAGQPMYIRQIVLALREDVDAELLRRAWGRAFSRHPLLRAALRWEGTGEPVVEVYSGLELPFEREDWREGGAGAPEARLEEFLRGERLRGFDLSRPPLLRLRLLRTGDSDYRLVWTFHHVLSDGHSDVLLVREVFTLYDAYRRGEEPALAELPSYREHCELQRRQDCARAESYWRAALKGFAEPTPLGMGLAHAADSGEERAEQALRLTAGLTSALKSLARAHDLTLSTMLHGAWALLLSRYSGKSDVVFGGVRGCRKSALGGRGAASVVGPFINTLPLRVSVRDDSDLLTLLKELRRLWVELRDYEQTPLVRVLDCSEVPRGTPLFESTVAFDKSRMNTELHAGGGSEWGRRELRTIQARSNYPLTVAAYGEDEFLITVRYDRGRFDDASVALVLERMRRVFEAMAEDIGRKLSDVSLLTEDEQRRLTRGRHAADFESRPPRLLHSLFEEQAARRPEAPAVVDDGSRLNYGELNARANRLARYLRRLGVAPESRVGICAGRGEAMLTALLGVLKAGGAYVPLDATYPAERLSYMAGDAGLRVVVTGGGESLPDCWGSARVVRLADEWEQVARESGEDLDTGLDPEAAAYVIYTSGSTGRPKGVVVTHANVSRLFDATRGWFGFDGRDVWTLFHSYAFDFSVWEIWGALLHGGRLVIVPFWVRRTPEAFYDLLVAEGVTVLNQTPSAFRQLMAADEARGAGEGLSLRLVIFGGEALNIPSLRPWFERHGDERPRLVNMYGITETTVHVTYRPLKAEDALGPARSMIGRPIPDLRLYILDSRMRPAPVGVSGEIHVGGGGLARGYLGRPALTAERFVPDPFSEVPGARLYVTGDVARYDADGDVEFMGRSDDQVKVRGFRIELGEIEAVAAQHPAVQEAAVIAREDARGQQRLAAYVVPDARRAATVRRLLRFEAEGRHADKSLHELPDGSAVFHLNRSETEFMYQEIFEERAYLRHGVTLGDGAVVFDVGANIGLFTLFAARASARATVYAFEPAPPAFEVLRANAELYGLDVRLFNCGLSDSPKSRTLTFYPHVSVVSGLYADGAEQREVVRAFIQNSARLGDGAAAAADGELLEELLEERLRSESFECEFRTLSDVMREHGVERVDLLKVDVEKSELDVLAGLREEDWPKVRQLVVEVHDVEGRLERIASMLRARGYEVGAQQDAALEGTGLYNLYAVRPGAADSGGAGVAREGRAWHGASSLVADLREFLASRLPNYMAPADFVLMESLPLTTNGKLDRRALPEPQAARARTRSSFTPPRTQAEKTVAEIWSEVLGVERVGADDNFFELGGQSLLATQMMSRLREAFGVTVPLRTIFERPTVAAVAECVTEAAGDSSSTPPIVRAGRGRPLPLSFEQRRLWFLDQLMPGSSFYNLPIAYRITGDLDAAALEEAVNRIVERHEALRTVFVAGGGEPAQVVVPHAPFRLDFAQGAGEDLAELIRREGRRPFDLARGPVLRAKLLRAGEREHVLVVTTHHIAADGWSVGLLTRELAALYEARVRGTEPRLPELPVQYADYASWQRQWLKGEALERQLSYWRRRLAGAPAALRLPTDHARPPTLGYRGAFERFAVAGDVFDGLKELGREEGVTLFMTLLAAYAALLARYSGDRDLMIGAPMANRARKEVENLIGFFTNTLVMRIDASGDPTFAELLRRVRGVCLGAYANRDVPFEKLVEELHPRRDMSRTPLFQVALSLQDAPAERVEAAGVVFEPGNVDIEASKFDLCLYAFPAERSLGGFLAYNLDLFERATAGRMVGHFLRLLAGAAREPGARLSELDMLHEGEKALLGGPSGVEDLEGSFSL